MTAPIRSPSDGFMELSGRSSIIRPSEAGRWTSEFFTLRRARCSMSDGARPDRRDALGWRPGPSTVVNRRCGERVRRRLSPALQALEDRRLLSKFHVTSTADDGSVGTLRWAVQQADAATTPSTIDFELGTAPATITL